MLKYLLRRVLELVLTLVLMVRKINGAILIGIFGTTLLGMLRGLSNWPSAIVSMPHASSTFLQLDLRGAVHLGFLEILFAFLFVDLFDNVGTLVGVCEQGGFIKDGKIPRVGRALIADGPLTDPCATRCNSIAMRTSPSMWPASLDAAPSTPSPTGAPAARSEGTGAMPA